MQAQEIAGLGGTDQQVHIAGTTLAQQAGGTLLAAPTGLLAQPTNIGDHSRSDFTFVNEIRAGVAYSLTEHLAVRAGYTLLYDSSVVRPGSQIDFLARHADPDWATARRASASGLHVPCDRLLGPGPQLRRGIAVLTTASIGQVRNCCAIAKLRRSA